MAADPSPPRRLPRRRWLRHAAALAAGAGAAPGAATAASLAWPAGPVLQDLLRNADNRPFGGSAARCTALVRQEFQQHQALLQRAPISLD